MPELFLEEDSSAMTERIDLTMLARIDAEQKATASSVDNIKTSLHSLEREVSEIKGLIKSGEAPAWIKHYVFPCAVLVSAGMITAVITLMVQMNGIQHFLGDNGGFVAGLRLEKIHASDPHKAQEAEQILAQAKKAKTKISPEVVEETGKKFIDVAKDDPSAWGTALAFVDYRSYLNEPNPPVEGFYPFGSSTPELDAKLGRTWYVFPTIPGKPFPQFTTSLKRTALSTSARSVPIGNGIPQEATQGPESILGVGGDVRLDGYYVRGFVFEGVTCSPVSAQS